MVHVQFPLRYDRRKDFDFDIVTFPFLDGDVSRQTSNGVHIPVSQLNRLLALVTSIVVIKP